MPKSRAKKVLSFLLISLVGVLIGIGVSYYISLRLSVPVTSGEIKLTGIDHPVEITFDSMGICQIWAETETDACFALGYQHAADRMFQMDVSRRLAGGRLSELLGSLTIEIDTEQRRIGHHRIAREALEQLSQNNMARLGAYAEGVNAYKKNCRAMPFEYRFLPVEFEDWTVEDCLTLLSFQSWYSNALMNRDDFYRDLVEKVGAQRAQTLVFDYPDWAPATVESGLRSEHKGTTGKPHNMGSFGLNITDPEDAPRSIYAPFQKAIADYLFSGGGLPMRMTHSSNAWVVDPSRSVSGKAILASDPHLETTRLPQFWYAAGLHVKQDSVDVLGITTPGLPFFVMGHNGRAAWAFTAGGVDVVDYYEEKINPENPNQYELPDGWREFDIIEDSFFVSDVDSFVHVTFKRTVHGPVMDNDSNDKVYSLHWAAFDVSTDDAVSNGFDLAAMQTFDQFQKAVSGVGALDANMVYADGNGNIGYQLTTPLRERMSKGPPFDLIDGSLGVDEPRYVPLAQTPNLLNPNRGWIASCNNLPQRSLQVQGHFFANRIVSITHLLETSEKFSTDDMRRFQLDRKSRYILRFVPLAATALDALGKTDDAAMMRAWDGSYSTESVEAALMEVFLVQFKELTFRDELGGLYNRVPSRWIEGLAQVDSARWFDDVKTEDAIETQGDIARNAMNKALAITNGAAWGEIHTLSMQHPLAMIPLLGGWLGLKTEPEPWGGSTGTLRASFNQSVGDGKFESVAGPSWRFVIDFANIDSATMVLPAGNSGNPMSDHFFDFYELWKTGRYWLVPFSYERVKERAASVLTIVPDSGGDAQ